MSTNARLICTNGAGLESDIDSADLVVVSFSRREIEAGRVGDAADRLLALSDKKSRVTRYEGKVLLEFAGYDFDPREIAEIPDARHFFAALTEQFGWWFHYLSKDLELGTEQASLAISLLTPLVAAPPAATGGRRFHLDRRELADVVRRLFDSMNALHQEHAISMDENRRISDSVIAVVNQAFT